MQKDIFTPADVLIPDKTLLEKWSVIACDQFSSEKTYWERVKNYVGNTPSAYNLIIPEAYLDEIDEKSQIRSISEKMREYLDGGVFTTLKDSFILVLRTQPDGRIRRGIVGAVDLEEYDFSGKDTAIRASEGTVLERLPARIDIRKSALLEMPHIITFINDVEDMVINPIAEKSDTLQTLYDFELMEGGGRIIGKRVTGEDAKQLMERINTLHEAHDTLMIMGDGNHSLAAAKLYWDEIKVNLPAAQREKHPARKALVEMCNVYDPAISFEAIHRVIFNVDVTTFIRSFMYKAPQGNDYTVRWTSQGESGSIGIMASCIGEMIESVQNFMDGYVKEFGDSIDYIHGEESVENLARQERCIGLLLPAMDKAEIFDTVEKSGVFPRKSFSVGHARDKRYYLECRKIVP